MSPTFKSDKTFATLWNLLYSKTTKDNLESWIFEDVNQETIVKLIEKQKSIKQHNEDIIWKQMENKTNQISNKKTEWIMPLEWYTILIDDLADSKEFNSFYSKLSNFAIKNRHFNI